MRDELLLEVLHDAATAVRVALDGLADWGDAGTRPGQYHSDVAADAAALGVLERAGLGALSEESGLHRPESPVVVVLDPVDGSTNASRDLPWYATSLCAVDADGARAALVVDQASGARFEATHGGGARVDGQALRPSACTGLGEAVVALSGYPPHWFGWKQFRAFGAAALDLCAVAGGRFDAYVDCSPSAHGAWDYLGGMLVCQEAGAVVVDAYDRALVTIEHAARRTPIAAATPALLDGAVAARRGFTSHPVWAEEGRLLTEPQPEPHLPPYPEPMRRLHLFALRVFRRLPVRARRRLMRTLAPSFTVGSICVIERADGAVLLVQQSYRNSWGIPGGLLKRGETPEDGARREVLEEVGLRIELIGEPAVVVAPAPHRVDVIFRARPAPGEDPAVAGPCSPEISEAAWFRTDAFPELQAETSAALAALARAVRGPRVERLVAEG